MSLALTLAERLRVSLDAVVESACAERFASRLGAQDPTLWGPEAAEEAALRLGWVRSPLRFLPLAEEVRLLRDDLLQSGMKEIVLCGMGGSSLGPEVMTQTSPTRVSVVDSTHPDVLAPILDRNLESTVVVVSSKSGTTIETDSHRRLFERAFQNQGINPAAHIVIVTDPDSELHEAAQQHGYRVFLGDPNIGGRYSALSPFGLVPAGLAGVDAAELLKQADALWPRVFADTADNPALLLGAAIAGHHPSVNKLLLRTPEEHAGLSEWIEQLVAESTGKHGRGLLPVVGSTLRAIDDGVSISSSSDADITLKGTLAELFVLWQVATAFACRLIGVNPFDQPNVESAKAAARNLLKEEVSQRTQGITIAGGEYWASPRPEHQFENSWGLIEYALSLIGPHSYCAVMIYADNDRELSSRLQASLEKKTGRPVTVGIGPRFLHSTGQLHKGGAPEGVFLSLVKKPSQSLSIPGRDFDCSALVFAQAHGDRDVLIETGQPVVALDLESDDFERLVHALSEG